MGNDFMLQGWKVSLLRGVLKGRKGDRFMLACSEERGATLADQHLGGEDHRGLQPRRWWLLGWRGHQHVKRRHTGGVPNKEISELPYG